MSGTISLHRQSSKGNKKAEHGHRKSTCTKNCDLGAMKYVKHVWRKVMGAIARMATTNPTNAPKPRHRHHNNSYLNKEKAKTSVTPVDSQRAEAIHDCIDFINSSSSLPRSNSVAR
ncbi:pyrimidine precursor biosynthesis enzyme THI5 [Striga asiatica]|uniref:Pyrimidine biosynthesis enzyme THI5 n=1 Tax=Striga asiatica TaxID=4170 RepID=A0A5A7P595_STRAF|nr:pyrimidine precursor biosynthesis enzyme THI5 [Striga asiatica]